jgi:transposase-like protein
MTRRASVSPAEHWRKIWLANGLERVNREIARRIDVAGVFPNPPALPASPAPC